MSVVEPRYLFLLYRNDSTFQINNLVSASIVNTTQLESNSSTFVFADPDFKILNGVRPRQMDVIQCFLPDELGTSPNGWVPIYTGYINSATHIFDPVRGDLISLDCSNSMKLWQITRLSVNDVKNMLLSADAFTNPSVIVQYAASSVGYPSNLINIHPNADKSYHYMMTYDATQFSSPDQQEWSAIVGNLLANTGLEAFFDETGMFHWRPLAFLDFHGKTVKQLPALQQNTILRAQLTKSDANVITDVEVRWRYFTIHGDLAGFWQAPASMIAQLRARHYVVYAPNILSKQGADYLAQSIGQILSANILTADMTVPATSRFLIGSLCTAPTMGEYATDLLATFGTKIAAQNSQTIGIPGVQPGITDSHAVNTKYTFLGGESVYYISSIEYNLVWGSQWEMTLHLTYGRAKDLDFPYYGNIPEPVLAHEDTGVTNRTSLITAAPTMNTITDQYFTLIQNTSLDPSTAIGDTQYFNPEEVIQILSIGAGPHNYLGDSPNGEYTVLLQDNIGSILYISNPHGYTSAQIKVVSSGTLITVGAANSALTGGTNQNNTTSNAVTSPLPPPAVAATPSPQQPMAPAIPPTSPDWVQGILGNINKNKSSLNIPPWGGTGSSGYGFSIPSLGRGTGANGAFSPITLGLPEAQAARNGGTSSLIFPILFSTGDKYAVTTEYGYNVHYAGNFHNGVDLAPYGGSTYFPYVVSVLPGVVIYAEYSYSNTFMYGSTISTNPALNIDTFINYGYCVAVLSGDVILFYAHLFWPGVGSAATSVISTQYQNDWQFVAEGQTVVAGQKLGRLDSTGMSTGNHLHFGSLTTVLGFNDPNPYLNRATYPPDAPFP